mmetsp:Transcript_50166/g.139344  ORF Transcript_50166/g.139344 Transcript_50166/m.139344 type:complete len:81 (-) Transcript_50166:2-244(-)
MILLMWGANLRAERLASVQNLFASVGMARGCYGSHFIGKRIGIMLSLRSVHAAACHRDKVTSEKGHFNSVHATMQCLPSP